AGRTTDHRTLRALAEDLAGDGASGGTDRDLLHVLARGLVAHLLDVSVGDARLDRIRLPAELDGVDLELHDDLVVHVLAALEVRDRHVNDRAGRDRGAVRSAGRLGR